MQWVQHHIVHPIVNTLFVQPLYMFFLNGPKVLGGWYGQQEEDICAELTSIPANMWSTLDAECNDLVLRHFNAYLVTAQMIVYMVTISRITSYLFCRQGRKPMILHVQASALQEATKKQDT